MADIEVVGFEEGLGEVVEGEEEEEEKKEK